MTAIFMHSSMAGIYWEPCEILDTRVWDSKYMSTIESDFGMNRIPTVQYLVLFCDPYTDEDCERWVHDYLVEKE